MNTIDPIIKSRLVEGIVIPAHPLALDETRKLDEARQRRLTRYYIESGAGGIAVAVHSTQFEIRDPAINLFEKVLALAAEECSKKQADKPFIRIAGICGPTGQAVQEAKIAVKHGYHMGLLSMGGLNSLSEKELIAHTRAVAEIIPVFGFYLQPSVGGRILSYNFWKEFAEIENVHAIKVAAFNRYQTLDVVRAVCNSSRREDIVLYTGNDDNIIADLLTVYSCKVNGKTVTKGFSGGLLGHWAVWTRKAVELLEQVKKRRREAEEGIQDLLTMNTHVTDMNAAIFDPANKFHGCIPGIHEVLRRQGLLEGRWCLNPREELSEGQASEIERVTNEYPHLIDDDFVSEFLRRDSMNSISKSD